MTKIGLFTSASIINRLDSATSKEKMSGWLKKTILPELLNIKVQNFTGKKFRPVRLDFDIILSELESTQKVLDF